MQVGQVPEFDLAPVTCNHIPSTAELRLEVGKAAPGAS